MGPSLTVIELTLIFFCINFSDLYHMSAKKYINKKIEECHYYVSKC